MAGAHLNGASRIQKKIGALASAHRGAARTEVLRAAVNVQSGAKARSPIDTGRLRNSIAHELRNEGLSAVVGTNVEYAPYLEFGTRKMAARPYLHPALEQERPQFLGRLQKALDKAARDVSRGGGQ